MTIAANPVKESLASVRLIDVKGEHALPGQQIIVCTRCLESFSPEHSFEAIRHTQCCGKNLV